AAQHEPVLVDRAGAVQDVAGAGPAAVVLQPAVDAVRPAVVQGDVVELADGHVVEEVPVQHAVVGGVEAAVAADDHVPAVLGVDPQRVLVGVDAVAAVGRERLAAVLGAVQADAADVEVVVVGLIDADLAEVHRPRVEAVDARPALAAVGRLVDAAVLEAFGTLRDLRILALAAVGEAVRPVAARAAGRDGGRLQRQHELLPFLFAQHLQRHLVAGFLVAQRVGDLLHGGDVLLVDGLEDVADLEADFLRRAVLDDLRQTHAALDRFTDNAGEDAGAPAAPAE